MVNLHYPVQKEPTVHSLNRNDLICYGFASGWSSELFSWVNSIFQVWYEVSLFFHNSDRCQKGKLAESGTLFIHSTGVCWMLPEGVILNTMLDTETEINQTWFIKTSNSLQSDRKEETNTKIYCKLQYFMHIHTLYMQDVHNTGPKWLRVWWRNSGMTMTTMAVSCRWWNLYLYSLTFLCNYISVLIQVSG